MAMGCKRCIKIEYHFRACLPEKYTAILALLLLRMWCCCGMLLKCGRYQATEAWYRSQWVPHSEVHRTADNRASKHLYHMVTRMDIFMWSNTQQLPADLNGTHIETFRQVHFGDQLS